MLSLRIKLLPIIALCTRVFAKTLVVSTENRSTYISEGIALLDTASDIASKDLFNGPPNPYDLVTFQTLECDFVEPDPSDPIGGTTPKFYCEFDFNGEKIELKIKYDQQYNPALNWGRANPEVYTSVISQRLLWATGFGADQSIPVTVKCNNCPIEPWTYIQAVQGYDSEDVASGWMDMELIRTGNWNNKLEQITFNSSIVYIKLNKYVDGDEIDYLDSDGVQESGFFWSEMYNYPTSNHSESVARDALSVIAAFISYCDNFDGNQGFMCLNKGSNSISKTNAGTDDVCEGQPLLYIHDVGGKYFSKMSCSFIRCFLNFLVLFCFVYRDAGLWLES